MYYYKLYGLVFKANQVINQLLVSKNRSDYDCEIIFGEVPDDIKEFVEASYTQGYHAKGFWFKNHMGIFNIVDGHTIYVEMLEDTPYTEGIPFVLGYCMAVLFGQRNMLAVHCGAVELKEQGIIIAGYSGAGKSSLTTKFIEDGHRLITDDVVVIGCEEDDIIIYPAFPNQNLCHDVVKQKGLKEEDLIRVDAERDKYMINRREVFCEEPRPLQAMFVLDQHDGEEVVIEEIHRSDKLKLLIGNLFAEPVIDTHGLPVNHMEQCMKIVKNIPIYLIKRPVVGDTTERQMTMVKKAVG